MSCAFYLDNILSFSILNLTFLIALKRLALLQSNYIPWKGYFDIINSVDEFVIYDEAQYTRRDWRNRNLIKTKNGLLWLTIPVEVKGRFTQKICETKIADKTWAEKHFKSIRHNYSSAPFFPVYSGVIKEAYIKCKEIMYLSEINRLFIEVINSILGVKTQITNSADYHYSGNQNEKIVEICKLAGADKYVTGKAARTYLDTELFSETGIEIIWVDYSGYPEYEQIYPPYEHKVSIIDLIFNKGEESTRFMKSF